MDYSICSYLCLLLLRRPMIPHPSFCFWHVLLAVSVKKVPIIRDTMDEDVEFVVAKKNLKVNFLF